MLLVVALINHIADFIERDLKKYIDEGKNDRETNLIRMCGKASFTDALFFFCVVSIPLIGVNGIQYYLRNVIATVSLKNFIKRQVSIANQGQL